MYLYWCQRVFIYTYDLRIKSMVTPVQNSSCQVLYLWILPCLIYSFCSGCNSWYTRYKTPIQAIIPRRSHMATHQYI